MAVLQKIRNGAGILVIIFVGVALFLFIIDPQTFDWLRNLNRTTIAEVGGDKVDLKEFQQYEMYHENYIKAAQNKSSLSAEESEQVKQIAWNDVMQKHLYQKEIAKAGISVGEEELNDLLYGSNIHYVIRQNFTNPNTGMMDTAQIKNFFENAYSNEQYAAIAEYWKTIIKADRLSTKYSNLIAKGFYAPTELAKKDYIDRNTQYSCELLFKNFMSIPDDSIPINEKEIKKYYEKNSYKYQQEKESREFEYVIFNVLPSSEDTLAIKTEIEDLYKEFNDLATGFEDFAASNDLNKTPQIFIGKENLPRGLEDDFFDQPNGTVSDIILDRNSFFFTKIMENDIRPDSVQLAYIAIAPNDTTTIEQCKHKADSIKILVETGKMDFQIMAYFNSADETTKQKGGDLGWFKEGIRPDLNEFAFKGKVGDMIILDLTNNQGNQSVGLFRLSNHNEKTRKVKLATIYKFINFSAGTWDKVYLEASKFMSDCRSSVDSFDSIVIKNNLIKRVAAVGELDNKFSNIENSRVLIKWVYGEEVKIGAISDVQDYLDKFLVAKVSTIKTKGVQALEYVEDRIKIEVIKNKKAEQLSEKMTKDLNGKNLIDLNNQNGYQYDTIASLAFSSFSIPGFGPEPKINGLIAGSKEDIITKPLQGNNGVYVLKVLKKTTAPEKDDYTPEKLNYIQSMSNQVYKINQSLEKNAKVQDYRSRFF